MDYYNPYFNGYFLTPFNFNYRWVVEYGKDTYNFCILDDLWNTKKMPYSLTPKAQRHILVWNCEKLPLFRAVRKKWKKKVFFQNSTIQICTRLRWECVEKISETLTAWIERLWRLKLEEKSFFQPCLAGPVDFNSS